MRARTSGSTRPATTGRLRCLPVATTRPFAVSFPRPDEFSRLVLRDLWTESSVGGHVVPRVLAATIEAIMARDLGDAGSPWQNAWIESFNGRLREGLLNAQQFETLLLEQLLIEDWRIDYNLNRPHSAHDWLTPVEFVEAWLNQQQLLLA